MVRLVNLDRHIQLVVEFIISVFCFCGYGGTETSYVRLRNASWNGISVSSIGIPNPNP